MRFDGRKVRLNLFEGRQIGNDPCYCDSMGVIVFRGLSAGYIDVDVTGGKTAEHNHSHADAVAGVVSNLPSLEQIQANLPPVESHGSCSTGGGHSAHSVFKAQVELPKPTEFQPRKTKVPLRVDEQRLIIATCEKGTVEDLDEMKDIKADIDKIKSVNPNYVDIAARDVFRHREVESASDSVPQTKGLFVS